jgi:hypothetical protein
VAGGGLIAVRSDVKHMMCRSEPAREAAV